MSRRRDRAAANADHRRDVRKSRREDAAENRAKRGEVRDIRKIDGEEVAKSTYIREPFGQEPDFGVSSLNYKLAELLSKGEQPR